VRAKVARNKVHALVDGQSSRGVWGRERDKSVEIRAGRLPGRVHGRRGRAAVRLTAVTVVTSADLDRSPGRQSSKILDLPEQWQQNVLRETEVSAARACPSIAVYRALFEGSSTAVIGLSSRPVRSQALGAGRHGPNSLAALFVRSKDGGPIIPGEPQPKIVAPGTRTAIPRFSVECHRVHIANPRPNFVRHAQAGAQGNDAQGKLPQLM
jgi:hypothetical protein